MRAFRCQQCGHRVAFEAVVCPTCDSPLGYLSDARQLCVVDALSAPLYSARGGLPGGHYWRCLNFAWGCNWMVPAASGAVWCLSCGLTRGRPDTSDARAVAAWADAEAAKRRLVFQLGELGLPVMARTVDAPEGLVFDLVFVPGASGVTGHREGVVTIDLTESDVAQREALRQAFGESYRTLLGHLRHEVGHFYWPYLVAGPGALADFRALFGDERADYSTALRGHYERTWTAAVPSTHVSGYAEAHPWEDWAESFAHYLHIRDAMQTALSFGLQTAPSPGREAGPAGAGAEEIAEEMGDFPAIMDRWRPLVEGVNAVSRSLGSEDLYPFLLSVEVTEKLGFVHERVVAAQRGLHRVISPNPR